MKINILSGSYKVIKSGSIIADEWASDIKFQLCPNAIISMTICLHFEGKCKIIRRIVLPQKISHNNQ